MNSAWRRLSNGMMPARIGIARAADPPQEAAERRRVEDRPGDHELGARLDLVLEAPQLLVEVRARRD